MSYIKFLKHGKRMGVVAVAGLLALAPVSSTVYAATSAVTTNNTATKNDLLNADIIDESKQDLSPFINMTLLRRRQQAIRQGLIRQPEKQTAE